MKLNYKKWWITLPATCSAALFLLPAVVRSDEPQDKKDASAEVIGNDDKPRRDRERGDQPAGGPGTRDERPGTPVMMVRMMMERFDKDGDEKLDREELSAALTALRQGGGPGGMFGGPGAGGPGAGGPGMGGPGSGGLLGPMGGRIFEQMDADKNGKLSGEEIPERLRQGMGRVDTNGDGAIDREEMKAVAERFGGRRGAGDQPRDRQSEEGNRLPRRPAAE